MQSGEETAMSESRNHGLGTELNGEHTDRTHITTDEARRLYAHRLDVPSVAGARTAAVIGPTPDDLHFDSQADALNARNYAALVNQFAVLFHSFAEQGVTTIAAEGEPGVGQSAVQAVQLCNKKYGTHLHTDVYIPYEYDGGENGRMLDAISRYPNVRVIDTALGQKPGDNARMGRQARAAADRMRTTCSRALVNSSDLVVAVNAAGDPDYTEAGGETAETMRYADFAVRPVYSMTYASTGSALVAEEIRPVNGPAERFDEYIHSAGAVRAASRDYETAADHLRSGQPIRARDVLSPDDGRTVSKYMTEFVFAAAINDINHYRYMHPASEHPSDEENPHNLILTTEARRLHSRYISLVENGWTDSTGKEHHAIDYLSDSSNENAARMAEALHELIHGSNLESLKASVSNNCKLFAKLVGMSAGGKDEPLHETVLDAEHTPLACVPLSPYDTKYASRTAFLDHGGQILFESLTDMAAGNSIGAQLSAYYTGDPAEGSGDPSQDFRTQNLEPLRRMEDPMVEMGDSRRAVSRASANDTTPGDQADRLNLSPLMQYFPNPADQSRILTAMRDGPAVPAAMVQKAENILDYLRGHGNAFALERVTPNGFDVRLSGTHYSVTLIDISPAYTSREEDEGRRIFHYDNVGSVFNAALQKRISIRMEMDSGARREAAAGPSQSGYLGSDVEGSELVPLQYALGDTVYWNGSRVSETSNAAKQDGLNESSFGTGSGKPGIAKEYATREGDFVAVLSRTPYQVNGMKFYPRLRISTRDREREAAESRVVLNIEREIGRGADLLSACVDSARTNFANKVGLEDLIEAAETHKDDAAYEPEYSDDPRVSEVQKMYWDVLTGKSTMLPAPFKSEEEYRQKANEILKTARHSTGTSAGDSLALAMSDVNLKALNGEYLVNTADYQTPADAVRAHFVGLLDDRIGQFERNSRGEYIRGGDGKLFSPDMVRSYETVLTGISSKWQRNDMFSDAIGEAGLTAGDLRGRDFSSNRMINSSITFGYGCRNAEDPAASPDIHRLSDLAENSPVMKAALKAVQDAVRESPAVVFDPDDKEGQNSIFIDKNGVIQYTVYRPLGMKYAFGSKYRKEHPDEKFPGLSDMIREYKKAGGEGRPELAEKYSGGVRIQKLVCQVGQVFDYDHETIKDTDGTVYQPRVVKTDFKAGDNYAFVPMKTADIEPKYTAGHLDKRSVPERLRIHTYENQLGDAIRMQVKEDLINSAAVPFSYKESGSTEEHADIGRGASVNSLYHHLYEEKLPYDYLDASRRLGNTDHDLIIKLVNMDSLVKLSTAIKEDTFLQTAVDYERKAAERGIGNNNRRSLYDDMGQKDRTVIEPDLYGYFDPVATATARNQGMALYLAKGAGVDENGHLYPARNPDGSIDRTARTAYYSTDLGKYLVNCPADRQIMDINHQRASLSVRRNVGFAQMSFGGWTYDDGYVVTKRFAENTVVPDREGGYRHLMVGDKITDRFGNKGTIALIADPDMPDDAAERMHLTRQIQFLRENPEIDVIGSPYPHVSRLNGGTALEAMQNPMDITVNGEVKHNCAGRETIMILKQTVDEKTNLYDDDDEGRNVSSQTAWAIDGLDAAGVMKEFYSDNGRSLEKMRDYINTLGFDLDSTANIRAGFSAQFEPGAAERHIIQIPRVGDSGGRTAVRSALLGEINEYGGFAELPFALKFPAVGEKAEYIETPNVYAVCTAYPESWAAKRYFPNGIDSAEKEEIEKAKNTYLLPVMDPRLRAGTDMGDEISYHEYTQMYLRILLRASEYTEAKAKREAGYEPDPRQPAYKQKAARQTWEKGIESSLSRAPEKAQAALNDLEVKIKGLFETRKSFIKSDVVKNSISDTATAVWTCNPNLNLDETAMSSDMAVRLKIAHFDREKRKVVLNDPNTHVLVWRDPVLNKDGVRYMKVVLNDDQNLTGIQINGMIDKPFEGDFDGDSVGVVPLRTEEGIRDALKHLTPEINLLDIASEKVEMPLVHRVKTEDGSLKLAYSLAPDGTKRMWKGYPIVLNDGMDLAAGEAVDPSLKERRAMLDSYANLLAAAWSKSGKTPDVEASYRRESTALINAYSDYAKTAFDVGFGRHVISYNSMSEHLQSVADYMNDGAKAGGKLDKLLEYAQACGIDILDASGKPVSAENGNTDSVMDPETKQIHIGEVQITGHPETRGTVTPALLEQYHAVGRSTEQERESLSAIAVKTFDVSGAGYLTQKIVGVTRNAGDIKLKDGLEVNAIALGTGITKPNTQAFMKLRQNPEEAARKDRYINSVAPKLMDGYDIYKEDAQGRRIPIEKALETPGVYKVTTKMSTTDGAVYRPRPVKANKNDWIKEYTAFYADPDGMNVSVNPEAVSALADIIGTTEYGQMDRTTDIRSPRISLIDRMMVYHSSGGGIVSALQTAAYTRKNLFGDAKDSGTQDFRPAIVRANQDAAAGRTPDKELRDIVSSRSREHPQRHKESGLTISAYRAIKKFDEIKAEEQQKRAAAKEKAVQKNNYALSH